MRQFAALLLGLVLGAGMAMAQDTPPGGEQLGSDRFLTRGDLGNQPVNSPDSNQQMTHAEGSSTGAYGTPGLSGEGVSNRTNQSPDAAGEGTQTGATAARRSEAGRDITGGAVGVSGTVWNSSTVRASNVIARQGRPEAPSAAQQGTTRNPRGTPGLSPATNTQQQGSGSNQGSPTPR